MSRAARPRATAFWPTVRLLLRAARTRSAGRSARQAVLLGRQGAGLDGLGCLSALAVVAVGCMTHCGYAVGLGDVARAAQVERAAAEERQVVSPAALRLLAAQPWRGDGGSAPLPPEVDQAVRRAVAGEGFRRGARADRAALEAGLVEHFRRRGPDGFAPVRDLEALVQEGNPLPPLVGLAGSLLLLGWFLALAFQGEGLELDLQRRRHPIWEWLLSHPVDPRAVFLAELLAPLSANPLVWLSPLFWIGAFYQAHGHLGLALVAGVAAGLPMAAAAGALGKAIEIVVLLRVAPRSRGAIMGILSWLGLAAFLAGFVIFNVDALVPAAVHALAAVAGRADLPLFGWLLGLGPEPSRLAGVLACWAAAAAVLACSTQAAALATRRGLAGGFGGRPEAPALLAAGAGRRAWREPVHRKELLWLWRDRGALVQVLLVPLTFAAYELFNLRGLASDLTGSWSRLAGATLLFGAYFLGSLGPRSLVSEGPALWLALTWPRGLEPLLKAKARLWWLLATALLAPIFGWVAWRFPADAWKVAPVAGLWLIYGRAVAEASVTMVTVPSSAGEPEPPKAGRRAGRMVGTLAFAAGVGTQQWQLALLGVVIAVLTSAATWQNFRARLPYLFDPWSETLPAPPTLLHAMISIGVLLELMSILTVVLVVGLGVEAAPVALVIAHGAAVAVTALGVGAWLSSRDVHPGRLLRWDEPSVRWTSQAGPAVLGASLGLVLGAAGVVYAALLSQTGWFGPELREAARTVSDPAGRLALAVLAIGLAPVAEELLFRGMLYRALDREWGGARAVVGATALFTVFHPPLGWPLVSLVGAVAALLFKRTGVLLPSILLHAAYNAVVTLAG